MAKNSPSKRISDRRTFLQAALIGGTAIGLAPVYAAGEAARDLSSTDADAKPSRVDSAPADSTTVDVKPFELDEITISELQDGMKSGKFTARSLAEKYTERIHEIDKQGPSLNAVIELNPDAFAIADALDQEHGEGKGPARTDAWHPGAD